MLILVILFLDEKYNLDELGRRLLLRLWYFWCRCSDSNDDVDDDCDGLAVVGCLTNALLVDDVFVTHPCTIRVVVVERRISKNNRIAKVSRVVETQDTWRCCVILSFFLLFVFFLQFSSICLRSKQKRKLQNILRLNKQPQTGRVACCALSLSLSLLNSKAEKESVRWEEGGRQKERRWATLCCWLLWVTREPSVYNYNTPSASHHVGLRLCMHPMERSTSERKKEDNLYQN